MTQAIREMPAHEHHIFRLKKCFEISYALLRVASALKEKRPNFAHYFETHALELLSASSAGDDTKIAQLLQGTGYLLTASVEAGAVHQETAGLIANQANELNAAIAAHDNAAKLPDSELKRIFREESDEKRTLKTDADGLHPHDQHKSDEKRKRIEDYIDFPGEERMIENPANLATDTNDIAESDSVNAIQERQYVILEKIRETGECGLKEIREFFPKISERTIRYDLQRLIEQGLVERVGTSGPATYYQARSSL